MEVKPGYKRTEVGAIPDEWEFAEFDTLGSIIDGDRGTNYPNSGDFRDSGHCLFLNAGNVTKEGFRFTECAFITREKDEQLSKGHLKRNDIVLTTRGTVGNLAYFDAAVPFEHMRINSGMVILRNESSAMNTNFLYILLQSRIVQSQVERLSFGSAQPQLTVKGISKFGIVIPCLPEQLAIADALSDTDALIESMEQLIAKKRLIKQGAMQELLTGRRRLPGFNGEWEIKRLGEVADVTMGQSPSSRFYNATSNGLPLVQGNADVENRKTIVRAYTSQITKRCYLGDIILSVRAPVGEVAKSAFDACIGRGVCAVRYPNDFLYQFLVFSESKWVRLSKGSTFDSVNSDEVRTFEIYMPDCRDEQQAIATVLSDMDAEIAALEQRRDKTKLLKQGMMQELLTGKTRLV